MGVSAVKTGYVADADQRQVRDDTGQMRRVWRESQAMVNHPMRVVETAARHQITINPHEPLKDTGLRRTYPNWATREGARGMGFRAWGQLGAPPEHEANLAFTRLLVGPMGFTPGMLAMATTSPDGVATTCAKQIALYVVIYSPLQMAAYLIETDEAHPEPFRFIREAPVDRHETVVLNGEVGDNVTIARRDHNSRDWRLGATTDENPRSLQALLTFLEPNRCYRACIVADAPDAPDAHWRGVGERLVVSEREVTSGDVLSLNPAPGGGQAISFEMPPT